MSTESRKPLGEYAMDAKVAYVDENGQLLSEYLVKGMKDTPEGSRVVLQRLSGRFRGGIIYISPSSRMYIPIGETARREAAKEKRDARISQFGGNASSKSTAELNKETPARKNDNRPAGGRNITPREVSVRAEKEDRLKVNYLTVLKHVKVVSFEDVRNEELIALAVAEEKPRLLVFDNTEGGGKRPSYYTSIKAADAWIRAYRRSRRTKELKVPPSTKNRGNRRLERPRIPKGFNRNPDNPATKPGGRPYCYIEVFLQNGGKATFAQLRDGCVKMRREVFGVKSENAKDVTINLTTHVRQWQAGKWGLLVEADRSNCDQNVSGKFKRGQRRDQVIYSLKQFTYTNKPSDME